MKRNCRFCASQIEVKVPTAAPMSKLVLELSSRACCNRCADYRRKLRDMSDIVQSLALDLSRSSPDDVQTIRTRIRKVLTVITALAEDHYLVSGYQSLVDDFAKNIFEMPSYARWQIEQFDIGVRASKNP